jgi:cell division protein FtsB
MEGPFVVAVVAIVFVFGTGILKRVLDHRERMAEARGGEGDELARLKERVAVLERIVTDDRYELDRAFRELDDAPPSLRDRTN